MRELGLSENLIIHKSRTGMYYANSIFRMSKPLDILRFTPLPFVDRIRLALLVVKARAVRDWRPLEKLTAREWLIKMSGQNVFRIIWEPLLRGKFGRYADSISAVWLWNKLRLRGSSRDRQGNEVLLYYRGGFGALAEDLAQRITEAGGSIRMNSRVTGLKNSDGRVTEVITTKESMPCDQLILTPALPILADLLQAHVSDVEVERFKRISYLANICLILRLDRSLSDIYWLNVNDPSFPFVGIIEHTNFESPQTYGGDHIVYLSRYLPSDDPAYALSDGDYLAYALPHLQRMFPEFNETWIRASHVWRAEYTQPIVERDYSSLIPPYETSLKNVYISTMAQIYPEDRGTNYAIRSGRQIADFVLHRNENMQ